MLEVWINLYSEQYFKKIFIIELHTLIIFNIQFFYYNSTECIKWFKKGNYKLWKTHKAEASVRKSSNY